VTYYMGLPHEIQPSRLAIGNVATVHITYSVEWEVHYCDKINRKDLKGVRRVPCSCTHETAVLTA